MEKDDYKLIGEQEFLESLANGKSFRNILIKDAVFAKNKANDLTFRNCVFDRVDFTKVSWIGLKCTSVMFRSCNLSNADLEDAVFENCSFFDPNSPTESRRSQSIYPPGGCKFLRANLHSATFMNCDLSFCVFEGANVFRITIEDSKATSTKFFRANFNSSARLINNIMHYADLRGAQLSKCDASLTDFRWANLDEVNFTEAVLVGSNLSGTTVRYAKFEKADLRGANIASFDIRTIDLHGAKIFESQMQNLLENCGLVIFPENH